MLFFKPWAINWVRLESQRIFSNFQHLGVDDLGLRSGHTDGPKSLDTIPLVGSSLKGTVLLLESPSVLVTKLLSEFGAGTFDFVGAGLELWFGVVLVLHLFVV